MSHKARIISLFLLVALILAGCGQVAPPLQAAQPDILSPQACSPYISMDETIRLLKSNGRLAQSQWATAGAVAKAESGLCVNATNPYNSNGSVDRGLYQINSVHGYTTDCLYNAACNTNAAMNIYRMQGWNAWTVYRTGAYRQHLSEAQAAVNRVAGGGSSTATGTTANTGSYTGPYNLRSGPGTNYSVVGSVGGGVAVTIVCQTNGTTHTGPWGTTSLWDKLSTGEWISDAFVYTGSNSAVTPRCN